MCDYTGRHFGASYPDACCIKGYLWDLDSDDGDFGLTSGGEVPCPSCNTAEYLSEALADSECTSWGNSNGVLYCGAMIIEGALRVAEVVNADAVTAWKAANPVAKTFDWPDREAVLTGRASAQHTQEVHICL